MGSGSAFPRTGSVPAGPARATAGTAGGPASARGAGDGARPSPLALADAKPDFQVARACQPGISRRNFLLLSDSPRVPSDSGSGPSFRGPAPPARRGPRQGRHAAYGATSVTVVFTEPATQRQSRWGGQSRYAGGDLDAAFEARSEARRLRSGLDWRHAINEPETGMKS